MFSNRLRAGEEYSSRWGHFQIDPLARTRGFAVVRVGLVLFHPQASLKERRQVKLFSAFNGPHGLFNALFFLCLPLAILGWLLVRHSPLSFWALPLLGLSGLAIWQVAALIIRRRTADLLETSAVWWPYSLSSRAAYSITDPALIQIVDQLDSLDSTPALEITEDDYLDRWQQIYDQARLIRTQRIADQTEHPRWASRS